MSADLFIRRLMPNENVDFVCSDEDLTSFFKYDCHDYLRELLAVTYLIEYKSQVIAMFSLCNDRLDVHDFDDDRKKLKRAARSIPHVKRGMQHFPAVKIARLAVREGIGNRGLGRAIVVFIQALFILKNKTGCRFLTVDSYPGAIGFYEKVGFKKIDKKANKNTESMLQRAIKYFSRVGNLDPNSDHVLMYLDLGAMKDSPKTVELGSIVDQLLSNNKAEFLLPEFPLSGAPAAAA